MERDHAITLLPATITPVWNNTGRKFVNGINTWDDWHLVPTSRPTVPPPEVYTNYVDLPGSHGKLDLSEYLTGGPVYKNRAGSFQFYAINGYGVWNERYQQLVHFLHGKRMHMALLDEPAYYYTGRFKTQTWASDGKSTWSMVTIEYELEPFKYPVSGGGGIL